MGAALAVVAVAAPLTGCSSGGDGAAPARTGPTSPAVPTVVRVDESEAGRLLTIASGSSVQVTLHSTYWRFGQPSPPGVLHASSPHLQLAKGKPAFPGSGAGTVTVTFTGERSGSARVVATRLSCGEALRCTPGEAEYHLTIVVR